MADCYDDSSREELILELRQRDKALFEVLLDTTLTHGQPTEGCFHPAEEPYPAQSRSLVLLRHRRPPQ
jgi:hypothetical protein